MKGEERARLIEVRKGNANALDILKEVDIRVKLIEEKIPDLNLPAEVDDKLLNTWLYELRLSQFQNSKTVSTILGCSPYPSSYSIL